jgi:hypothetical protein
MVAAVSPSMVGLLVLGAIAFGGCVFMAMEAIENGIPQSDEARAFNGRENVLVGVCMALTLLAIAL